MKFLNSLPKQNKYIVDILLNNNDTKKIVKKIINGKFEEISTSKFNFDKRDFFAPTCVYYIKNFATGTDEKEDLKLCANIYNDYSNKMTIEDEFYPNLIFEEAIYYYSLGLLESTTKNFEKSLNMLKSVQSDILKDKSL